ncbi:uncharacterized protein LOC143211610 [Lasioglossum baleicum]|uniref:uncharacterized protein LOC143211610 n=1 Tax=Lasioglossum baleicum TaxID=434251 RepID=UPI003FCD51A8
MLEREFIAYNVKADAVKCSSIIRNLDQATMKTVLDVIEGPADRSTYEHIKEALIDRLAKSDEANLRKLLTSVKLGNKKPSELLREMSQLARKSVGDKALRTLWIQRLPTRIQEILAIIDDTDLEKLAKLADKVTERSGVAEMAAISDATHATREARDDVVVRLQDGELAAIVKRLSRLETRLNKPHGRSNSRKRYFRQRSSSRSRETTRTGNGFCFYHNRFGAESWKCRKPCTWTGTDKQHQGN